MALNIQIEEDIKAVDRHLFKTETVTIKKAATAAINKTLNNVKTTANREIRDLAWKGVKAGEINQHFKIKKSTWSDMSARITAVPYAPNLKRYKAKMTKSGLKASPRGTAKLYKGAFLGNDGRTVFTRRTKSRLPIVPVHGPNLPREFEKKIIRKAMDHRGAEMWPKNFAAQLKRLLKL